MIEAEISAWSDLPDLVRHERLVRESDPLLEDLCCEGANPIHLVRMDGGHRQGQELFSGEAEHLAGLFVDVQDAVDLDVDEKDTVVRAIEDLPEAFVAALQGQIERCRSELLF